MDYVLKELVISSGIGFALNYLSQSVFGADLIKGDPRWMYNLGIFYQAIVFPVLCYRSYKTKKNLSEWLNLPWKSISNIQWDKYYLAALWGYWLKDMFSLSDPLIVVHHLACMTALFACILNQSKPGLGYFITELGTAAFNINNIQLPNTFYARYFYYISMTLSNIVSVFMVAYYTKTNAKNLNLFLRIFYVLIVAGIAIGRQREVILNYFEVPHIPPHVLNS